MGDVTDLESHRKKLRESIQKDDDDALLRCPKCNDLLCMVVLVPDWTEVDEMGPYALICQHCSEPWGSVYLFDEDPEDGEDT